MPVGLSIATPPAAIRNVDRELRLLWLVARRFRFPWTRTAVSSPVADDDLLIVNMTEETWALSLGYHDLGTMPPYERQEVNVARKGRLYARRVAADTDPLTLALTPAVRAVEIGGAVRHGVTVYHLRAIERSKARRRIARPAGS